MESGNLVNGKNDSRTILKQVWEQQDATVQGMMLNTRSEELSGEDVSEIISFLPELAGLDVLELGAGIGRFTSHLAERAKRVLVVDFVEKFIEQNKAKNSKFGNIDYVVGDAMDLNPQTVDFIFANWLFSYLDNASVKSLLQRMLTWLPINGRVFVRESCLYGSGDLSLDNTLAYYRDVGEYESLFVSATVPTEDGQAVYGLDLMESRTVNIYKTVMNNENQVTWLLQKVRGDAQATPKSF